MRVDNSDFFNVPSEWRSRQRLPGEGSDNSLEMCWFLAVEFIWCGSTELFEFLLESGVIWTSRYFLRFVSVLHKRFYFGSDPGFVLGRDGNGFLRLNKVRCGSNGREKGQFNGIKVCWVAGLDDCWWEVINKLLFKCSVVDVTKVASRDCFRKPLRIVNEERKFYEVMASNERWFRICEVNDRLSMVDYE